MKHAYTFLLFIIAFPLFTQAQEKYKPGYVVTPTGDTLKGLINYKQWLRDPNRLPFKKDGKAEILLIANVDAFGINDLEYYHRYIGPIGQDHFTTGNTQTNVPGLKTDTVFLRLVTSGKNVSLYKYTDDMKIRYFIADHNSMPIELILSGLLNSHDPDQPYRIQLAKLAATYQPQNTELPKLITYNFYTAEIKDIVVEINGRTQDHIFSRSKAFKLFISTGANSMVTKAFGDAQLTLAKQSTSITPIIGFGTDFFLNRVTKTAVFRLNLDATANFTNLSYDANLGVPYTVNYKFSQYLITLNPQFLYNFVNKKNFKFYAAAGVAINYSIYSGIKNNITYFISPGVTSTSEVTPIGLSNIFFNFSSKVGFSFNNRLELFVGFVPSYTMTNYTNYTLNSTGYRAGINYLLGSKN